MKKKFIHDSFANRIGKDGLNAIKRFDIYKRKESKISRKKHDLNREELIKKNKLTKIDVNK